MAKRPIRKTIEQPSIPEVSLPAYLGQNYPESEVIDILSKLSGNGKLPLKPSNNTSAGGAGNPNSQKNKGRSGSNLFPLTQQGSPSSIPTNVPGNGSWFDMVQQGALNGDDFAKLLEAFGINYGKEMESSAIEDWNKKITETLLTYWLKQNERSYDEQRTAEQRIYDTPTNQLARLMGAGISRDAALQLLGGSASGAGGAAVGVGGAMQLPDSPAPSESKLNQVRAITEPINTAFSALGTLAGLVNLGFSAPMAIQQTHYLQMQNQLLDWQLGGYKSANDAFSILQAAGATAESFGSVSAAAGAIAKLAEGGNQDALNFITSGGLDQLRKGGSFSSQVLSNLNNTELSAERASERYVKEMRKMDTEQNFMGVQMTQMFAELKNTAAEYDEIVARTDYQKAMKVTCQALGIKYKAETRLTNLQSKDLESLYASSHDGKSYLDWRNTKVLSQLVTDAGIAQKTNNPEYLQATYDAMFKNQQSVAAAMQLAALADSKAFDFATEYPEQFKLYQGLLKSGAYDYLQSKVDTYSGKKITLPFGISWTTAPSSVVFDPNNPYYIE